MVRRSNLCGGQFVVPGAWSNLKAEIGNWQQWFRFVIGLFAQPSPKCGHGSLCWFGSGWFKRVLPFQLFPQRCKLWWADGQWRFSWCAFVGFIWGMQSLVGFVVSRPREQRIIAACGPVRVIANARESFAEPIQPAFRSEYLRDRKSFACGTCPFFLNAFPR